MAVKRYDGSAWQVVAGKGDQGTSSSIATWVKTASGGETSLSGNDDNSQPLSYTVGQELVFINGALQKRGVDYTATTGTSITGLTALVANDVVTVWTVNAFSVANTYTQAQVDAAFVNNTNYWSAGKNKIINGDFAINQRGFSSVTASAQFTFDRFKTLLSGGTVTYTPETFTLGSAPVSGYEAKNYLRIVTSGQSAASDYAAIFQPIESVRTFAGQTVTVSFWAKAASGTPNIAVNLLQLFGGGGSPSANVSNPGTKQTLTTSWARYSFTINVASISGKTLGTDGTDRLSAYIYVSAGSDYNTQSDTMGIQNNTFDIWGVQVEAGSVATAFQTATGNPASELAACQRYFVRFGDTNQGYGVMSWGQAYATTHVMSFVPLPVTMRVKPSSITFTNLRVNDWTSYISVSTMVIENNYTTPQLLALDATVTGATTKIPYTLGQDNNTAGKLEVNAEL